MGYRGNRSRPSSALVVSFIALFIALSGVALALERASVKGKHIAKDAVKSKHVKAGTLNGKDFDPDALAELDGPPGPPGADGSPDTPQQVLQKLLGVDGSGSGLDADTVHGIESYDFHVERAPNAFDSISVLGRDGFDISLDCGAGDLRVRADPDPGTELFATWISEGGASGADDTGGAPDVVIDLNVFSVSAQGTLTALSSDGTITNLEYTGLRGFESAGVPCRFYGHARVSKP